MPARRRVDTPCAIDHHVSIVAVPLFLEHFLGPVRMLDDGSDLALHKYAFESPLRFRQGLGECMLW